MRAPYPRPRPEATLGLPPNHLPIVAAARRPGPEPDRPAPPTNPAFCDRDAGENAAARDAGRSCELGEPADGERRAPSRRVIEEQAGGPHPMLCAYCGLPIRPHEGCQDPACRAEGWDDAEEAQR